MHSVMRISLALLIALACSVSVSAKPPVAAATENDAGRFTFFVPNAPESTVDGKDRFRLTINRWSTDAERDRVLAIVQERGMANLLDAFRETSAVGYLRWPGGLEYSVRYAYRAERPDGGADVILVLDRPAWVWWTGAADAKTSQAPATSTQPGTTPTSGSQASTAQASATQASSAQASSPQASSSQSSGAQGSSAQASSAPFGIVQLRVNKDGQGEGRVSQTNVATDKRLGVHAPDYAKLPVLMSDVRAERG